jgi:hypothetical protein
MADAKKSRFFARYKWLVILSLVAGAAFFAAACHLYQKDVKALEAFSAACEVYDKAASDLFAGVTGDLEKKAKDALSELETKATLRLSSLIKNDGELMRQALEIKDLSRNEFDGLRAYASALRSHGANLEALTKECGTLINKRKAAVARFRELGGLRGNG